MVATFILHLKSNPIVRNKYHQWETDPCDRLKMTVKNTISPNLLQCPFKAARQRLNLHTGLHICITGINWTLLPMFQGYGFLLLGLGKVSIKHLALIP